MNNFKDLGRFLNVGQYGKSGTLETNIKNVSFYWANERVPKSPLMTQASIIIIGQGHKIAYLSGKRFQYDKDHYLVSSIHTAFDCETFATPENPLYGLWIKIDLGKLKSIVAKIEKHNSSIPYNKRDLFLGLEPVKLDQKMQEATLRLLSCLKSKEESEIFGEAIVDELIYYVLMGKHGKALYALSKHESNYAKIAKSISLIQEDYSKHISIEELAHTAEMSVTSFHRCFKKATGESPLQFLKKFRLNIARDILRTEGSRVSEVAFKVGYESQSQFSREYKRFFNVSPSESKKI